MDFLSESLFETCRWCDETIKMSPIYGILKKEKKIPFCCIFCAKLYNDYQEKIVLDFMDYTNKYFDNLLSEENAKIYKACRDILFEAMPTYTFSEDELKTKSRLELMNAYKRMFMS